MLRTDAHCVTNAEARLNPPKPHLNAAISYYGGKTGSARYYPAPQHSTIVEPFAGGAGYSLRWYDRDVILVEKDPVVAGVWDYLINGDPARILELPDVLEGENVDDKAGLCDEERHLIGFWLNCGSAAPCKTPSKWVLHNREINPSCCWWTAGKRAKLAKLSSAVGHWRVIQCEYADAPDIEATWFVDPPYQEMGKHYKCGSSSIDFDALGAWCQSLKGQAIVCENVGADWLPFEPFRRTLAAHGQTGRKHSDEAIWLGGQQ